MDKISYLSPNIADSFAATNNGDVLFSKLMFNLQESKQNKAGANQWLGIINAFSQKGVKQAELDDIGLTDYLKTKPSAEKIDKTEILAFVARRLPRIKCVDLDKPVFPGYRNMTSGVYTERLYILASEGMVADDQIEDLMYRIEALGFDPSPLITDPELVDRLEAEMQFLKNTRPDMFDFVLHHFSVTVQGHGKNLMAHARISETGETFFVEEIQSDWAQKGRSSDWAAGYPKAPFVTNTELWASVVVRDLLHRAAANDRCNKFAWINGDMRNGFDHQQRDNLDAFYSTIVKKIVSKAIEKAGGQVSYRTVTTKNGEKSVQGFEMTDAVRAALLKPQPMYSREALMPRSMQSDDPDRAEEKAEVIRECAPMLGSAHTIRFAAKLYNVSQGTEVAGLYLHNGIELSLRAKNLNRVARHESWHFADENFLLSHEKRELRLAFSAGTPLNDRVQGVLRSMNEHDAANQCVNEKECTAHAFSLWCEGAIELDPKPLGIFQKVLNALERTADWLEEKVFGIQVKKPEDLFQAMREGALARREQRTRENEADFPAGG